MREYTGITSISVGSDSDVIQKQIADLEKEMEEVYEETGSMDCCLGIQREIRELERELEDLEYYSEYEDEDEEDEDE